MHFNCIHTAKIFVQSHVDNLQNQRVWNLVCCKWRKYMCFNNERVPFLFHYLVTAFKLHTKLQTLVLSHKIWNLQGWNINKWHQSRISTYSCSIYFCLTWWLQVVQSKKVLIHSIVAKILSWRALAMRYLFEVLYRIYRIFGFHAGYFLFSSWRSKMVHPRRFLMEFQFSKLDLITEYEILQIVKKRIITFAITKPLQISQSFVVC